MGVSVHTIGTELLVANLDAFTAREGKAALRSGVRRATSRGRTLVRAGAPVKTGIGRAGIRSVNKSAGITAVGKVYPSGAHAHIMRWQDQGTGGRHKHNGQYTGVIEPQYFFERGATELEPEIQGIFDTAILEALAKSGLI